VGRAHTLVLPRADRRIDPVAGQAFERVHDAEEAAGPGAAPDGFG